VAHAAGSRLPPSRSETVKAELGRLDLSLTTVDRIVAALGAR